MKSKINIIGMEQEINQIAENFFIYKGFSVTQDINDTIDSIAMVVERSCFQKAKIKVDIPVIIVDRKEVYDNNEWKSIWKQIGVKLAEKTVWM